MAGSNEAAGSAKSLTERPYREVNLVADSVHLRRSEPMLTEHAGSVSVIDIHFSTVPMGYLNDLVERRHAAMEREHAVSNDQFVLGIRCAEERLQVLDVQVVVKPEPGAVAEEARGGHCQPINDAGVDQLVEEDLDAGKVDVRVEGMHQTPEGAPHKGRYDASIRQIAGREDDCVLPSLEPGDTGLQLLVQRLRTRGKSGAAGTEPIVGESGTRCLNHCRVLREPEVIVGREVDAFPSLDAYAPGFCETTDLLDPRIVPALFEQSHYCAGHIADHCNHLP